MGGLTGRRLVGEEASSARADLILLLHASLILDPTTLLDHVPLPSLEHLPEFLGTLSTILLRVVSEMSLEDESLVDGDVARVDGDTVVVAGTTGTDVHPVPVLLSKVETGGVGDEDPSHDPTGETEPAD